MNKFIVKIIIFILPIALLAYPIDKFISTNLKKSNEYAHKEFSTWNDVLDGKLNSEIFILGSSRAWVHFDPEIIEDSLNKPVYNLGIDGHSFSMQYLRYLLAVKNNHTPKLIIQSVDPGTLQTVNLYNPDQFLPYMLNNSLFYKYMSKLEGYKYFDYHLPLLRYYGKLDALKTAYNMTRPYSKNSIERNRGYQGQNASWNSDFEKAKKSMEHYNVMFDHYLVDLFEKFLKDCNEQNIEVVMVYSPVYIEGQEFINNQKEIVDKFENYAKKYNFLFINFLEDEISFDKKNFYNAMHLNITGAEKFSKKLSSILKKTNNN
jgi:hypothetical protein